ncbi:MAG: cyclodeaminase/cyclohydrolase family protein, partial [Bacteroidales bacterium]|nr:cyclodeaminase/cyclohydrolase family protein [Bacteroidales bacterium]
SLDDLCPFNPREKVIEYLMEDPEEMARKEKLVRMTLKDFAALAASEAPAPGGGSVAAYMGALGAGLATMVANLSSHKRGWDDRWKEFSDIAEKGQALVSELTALVDEDTAAFDAIMNAFGLPKESAEEKAARAAAIQAATLNAASVPLRTMEAALKVLPLALEVARKGLSASASDAGVAALSALAAVRGAALNVRINAACLKDRASADPLLSRAEQIEREAQKLHDEVLAEVNSHIG